MDTDDSNQIAFCAFARSLDGERPESYVGSAEHLRDVERLAALAPEDLRHPLETFRAFLTSGSLVGADPDLNLTSRWPAEVQAALAAVQDYIAENC